MREIKIKITDSSIDKFVALNLALRPLRIACRTTADLDQFRHCLEEILPVSRSYKSDAVTLSPC